MQIRKNVTATSLFVTPSTLLASPMAGRILDLVPGHTNIGRGQNFVHLVTGHTPGRINRNGTVSQP